MKNICLNEKWVILISFQIFDRYLILLILCHKTISADENLFFALQNIPFSPCLGLLTNLLMPAGGWQISSLAISTM